MVFDRGSIKWASLMLPEHVKALREWRDHEMDPRAATPIYDEQLNETFDQILQEACVTHHPLSVTFIKDGREHTVMGIVNKLDSINETMTLCDRNEKKWQIPIHHIIKMN